MKGVIGIKIFGISAIFVGLVWNIVGHNANSLAILVLSIYVHLLCEIISRRAAQIFRDNKRYSVLDLLSIVFYLSEQQVILLVSGFLCFSSVAVSVNIGSPKGGSAAGILMVCAVVLFIVSIAVNEYYKNNPNKYLKKVFDAIVKYHKKHGVAAEDDVKDETAVKNPYVNLKNSVCAKCGKYVHPSEKVLFGGKVYCKVCLGGKKVYGQKEPASVPKAEEKRPATPVKAKQPVVSEKNQKTICKRCYSSIYTEDAVIADGNELCKKCYSAVVAANNKMMCCVCKRKYDESTFIYADGKYYCKDCFDKTFRIGRNVIVLYESEDLRSVTIEGLGFSGYRLEWNFSDIGNIGGSKDIPYTYFIEATLSDFVECIIDFVPDEIFGDSDMAEVRIGMRRALNRIEFKENPEEAPIFLFGGGSADTENSVSENFHIYIDPITGDLSVKLYVCTDPLSMRPGSTRVSGSPKTYEEFYKILDECSIEDKDKFKTLTRDNWKEWLKNNGYIK